jgi:cell division protein FtsL
MNANFLTALICLLFKYNTLCNKKKYNMLLVLLLLFLSSNLITTNFHTYNVFGLREKKYRREKNTEINQKLI